MEYILPGEMVEGAHCDVMARKVNWKGLKKDPITDKPMTLYELDRNCSVEITRVMVFANNEEADKRKTMGVHQSLGDKIRADKIQLFVDTKSNNVRFDVNEGVTATHGAHLANISKRSIGRIKYALDTHIGLIKAISDSAQIKAIL